MASLKLQALKDGLNLFGKALKHVASETDKAVRSLSESASNSKDLHDLQRGIVALGLDSKTTSRMLAEASSQYKTLGDRIVDTGGPLGDMISGLQRGSDVMRQYRRNHAEHAGAMGKSLISLALFAKGLQGVVGGLQRASQGLDRLVLDGYDQARLATRGTALMSQNTRRLKEHQYAIQVNANAVADATGMTVQASTEMASSVAETLTLTGRESRISTGEARKFTNELAQIAKATGLSAGEMGEFNKQLMVNLSLSPQTARNVASMLVDVQRFGLRGKQAMDMIQENQDAIMSIDASGRQAFIGKMLDSAGTMQRAGVDFKKYASRLLDSKGVEATQKESILAAYSGINHTDVRDVRERANAGDDVAQIQLLEIQRKAFDGLVKHAGIDAKKFREDMTKFRTGTLGRKDRDGFLERKRQVEYNMEPDIIGQTMFDGLSMDALMGLPDQIKKAVDSVNQDTAVGKSSVETVTPALVSSMEDLNRTIEEDVNSNLAAFSKLLIKSNAALGVMANTKIAAQTAIGALEPVSQVAGGVGSALGGLGMAAIGLFGVLKAGKLAGGLLKAPGALIRTAALAGTAALGSGGRAAAARRVLAHGGKKALAKVAAKKIPLGVGLLIASGFALNRLMQGDVKGAGMEVASGAAAIVPGLGTAASLGIDAMLMKRDYDKEFAAGETDPELEQQEMAKEAADSMSKMPKPVVPGGKKAPGMSHADPSQLPEKHVPEPEMLEPERPGDIVGLAKDKPKDGVKGEDVQKMIAALSEMLNELRDLNDNLSASGSQPGYA